MAPDADESEWLQDLEQLPFCLRTSSPLKLVQENPRLFRIVRDHDGTERRRSPTKVPPCVPPLLGKCTLCTIALSTTSNTNKTEILCSSQLDLCVYEYVGMSSPPSSRSLFFWESVPLCFSV